MVEHVFVAGIHCFRFHFLWVLWFLFSCQSLLSAPKGKSKQLRIQKLKTASNVFEQSQVQKAYQKPNKSLLIDKKVASTTWWGCSWMEKTKTKNSLFGEVRGIYQLLIWVMLETDLFCALLP